MIATPEVIGVWLRRNRGLRKFGVHVADRRDMDPSAIALEGLHQADAQLEQAAARIASFGASSDGNVDVVDLSAEFVALMTARMMFDANLATLKTAGEMQKSLIDVSG